MCSEELTNAAKNGDLEFLRNCVASNKPNEHYFKITKENLNIFHVAVNSNRLDFIKEAIKILPFKTIHNLLLDQSNEQEMNPLHHAAVTGNIKIVKLILDVYRLSPPLPDIPERPWLAKDVDGDSPCHFAIGCGHEACGLEIWRMDMEYLSDMLDNDGSSLLGAAIKKGFTKMALEMLRSPFRVRCTYIEGYTALHFVAHCSSGSEEEICRILLERDPELITQKAINQYSVLHYWATLSKLWPFEVLLRSNDIVPNVRKIFVDFMSSIEDTCGLTPLHILAIQDSSSKENVVEIAKFLIETYKQEVASSQMSKTLEDIMYPWLIKDFAGCTPLFHAINNKKEKLAMYMLVEDNNTLKLTPNALLFSIEKGCHEVANKILDIVDEKGWIHLLQNQEQVNALHLAPLCKREFCERLLSSHPQLVEKVDKDGATVLHSWVTKGEVWLFEYIFQSLNIKRRTQFVKLISDSDFKLNYPLHYVAQSDHEASFQIAKLLIESFKQENLSWTSYSFDFVPWFGINSSGDGPMHLAMSNHREKLALYLLSLLHKPISQLLDYYRPKRNTLFMAIENGCFQFAQEILMKLDKECWSKYCIDSCDGRTILHLAPHCKDQEFIRWLVQEAPLEFISQKDDKGETALDEASNVGDTFTIQAMLQKDPLAFSKVPLAWVKACEKGNISVVRVFINCYNGKFSDHCIRHQDSPLHHIKLRNTTEYEEFLDIPCMKALINVQNFHGETPLHKAIKDRNIFLTEALLSIQKTKCNIKDHENNTAKDLLQQLYQEDNDWKQMCKSIEFDPTIKTTYFQNKANLLDARNTLALVAALLATITFTAGFTVPGGFDQNTGEVMLGKKAAFLVFLLSDTVAMCCSMLILIFLVWSMVYDPNKSLVLIDHSMKLLLISLYSTLLAFMTGVYVVISPKSRWVAILVIVMCSCIGVLANMNWMYRIRDKLFAIAKRDSHKDPLNLLEEGKSRDEHDRLICHDIESSQGRELEEISRAG